MNKLNTYEIITLLEEPTNDRRPTVRNITKNAPTVSLWRLYKLVQIPWFVKFYVIFWGYGILQKQYLYLSIDYKIPNQMFEGLIHRGKVHFDDLLALLAE